MTPNAKKFIQSNRAFKVVYGSAIEQDPRKPSKGVIYRLDNGETYRLSPDDLKDMPIPDWGF